MDFANNLPSLGSWFITGMMAVTFITFFKYVLTKWDIPGLSPLFASI